MEEEKNPGCSVFMAPPLRMPSLLWAVIKEVSLAHLPVVIHPTHRTSSWRLFLLVLPMEFSFLWIKNNISESKIDKSEPHLVL